MQTGKSKFIKFVLITSLLSLIERVQSIIYLSSIYCPSNAGLSTSYYSCQSCDQVFALNNSATPNCQPNPPDMYVYEASSASGLTVSYSSFSTTACGSRTTINGWMSPTDTVQVRYPGVTRTYTAIKIFFGIVSRGTWSGPEQIETYFNNMGDLRSRSIFARDIGLTGQCSADSTDYYYRIRQDYTYSTQNTQLLWNLRITGDPGTTDGQWAITQVLLLLRACDIRCVTCTTSTTACTSCVTSGTYQSFLISATQKCVDAPNCPISTFASTVTHVCESCGSSNCAKCTGVNVCTECVSTFFLWGSSCVSACPTGTYPNSAITPAACTTCPNQCTICSSSTSCSACTTSGTYESYLSGTSCVAAASCPTGTYPQPLTHVCTTCNTSCTACSITKDNCTACISSLYYLSNICYSDCPVGYYQNTGTGLCTICNSKCIACLTTATECTACTTSGVDQSYLSGTSCIAAASCPTGTYPQPSTHICTTCNTSCTACSMNINNCTACVSGLFFLSNVCYSDCPVGYYQNTGTGLCTVCNSKCTACLTTATECTGCKTSGVDQSYLTGTSCVVSSSCPVGTYPQPLTHVCTTCNTSCSACSIAINNCTACISGLYLLSNICYSDCPVGNYQNTGTGQCTICNIRCTACLTSATDCTACTTSGASQSFLIQSSNSCVASSSCPSTSFPDPATHICTTCNTSCMTCSGNIDNCTSCVSGLYYLNNVCYVDCPVGYYQSVPATKMCYACNNYCAVCDVAATNCTSCITSGPNQAYLTGTSCVVAASCPIGTYPQPTTHICTACNTSCYTCQTTPNTCTACPLGLYYLPNICYLDCPIGYYQSVPATKQCLQCNSRCISCDITSTNCSACTTSGTFQSYLNTSTNSCVLISSCANGYYGNVLTHVCQVCNSSCATCTGTLNNCTWCVSPLYLLNNICYTVCPLSYYGNAGICILCDPLCLTCTGTTVSQCLSCKTVAPYQSFFLSANTTCYVTCPVGYFPVVATHICQKCDISCSSCTNSPSPCQSCNSSYVYFNQTCLSACPNGYYAAVQANLTYKVCLPCTEACLTCYGGTDDKCYSCNFDMMVKKSGSYCRLNCMPGWGDIFNSQFCVYCNPKCTGCYNSGTNCTSCYSTGGNAGFFIITNNVTMTGNCYNPCPNGYFANTTSRTCDLCLSPCATCNKLATNCTSCVNGTYWFNFTCVNPCPDNYFINATACSKCNTECLLCSGLPDNCTLCNSTLPTFYYNNKCLYNCPIGFYKSPTPSNYTCQRCNIACSACTGDPSPCSACNPYYFYYLNTCNTSCYEPGYFGDIVTWTCLSCDLFCVRLTIDVKFQTQFQEAVIFTLTFTQDLDWNSFDMAAFQDFGFSDPFFTIDMFSFDYTMLNSRTYQIRITPKLYIFMYNLQITLQTQPMPFPNINASNMRPFHQSVYNETSSIIWSHIKAPGVTEREKNAIISMMNVTAQLQKFTNASGVRELVQSGIFAFFLPGIQITSAMVLVNGVIPQHMYEGIRIMATAIFYQVPKWEKNADNSRSVFNDKIKDMIPDTLSTYLSLDSLQQMNNQTDPKQQPIYQMSTNPYLPKSRRVLQTQSLNTMPVDWRFKRTGFSTFFILDLYMQIILLAFVWILVVVFKKCIYKKEPTHKNVGRVFQIFHKIHQISLMYVTIALVLQWLYFQKQNQSGYKWVSFICCIVLLAYFLAYELYIYYDMFQYPEAHVNTRSYLQYVTKYGHFLNKIRYQEYDISEEWSPKVWFRPYNYHILSFYKKFMMIFCLPIFHQLPYTQCLCLIFLQVLEIARFVVTWPFVSKFRNIYRIVLEVLLLLIFIIVLVTQYLSAQLMRNNPATIQQTAKWFNLLGWLGLIFVIVFNLSVFIIAIYDFVTICKKGDSIAQMDQIRKQYYWQKVKKYEQENQDINVDKVSNWVKLGNLREQENMHQNCKYITVKIQKLKIQKIDNFYSTHITHVTELRINKEGFIYEENSRRLQIKDKVRKFMQISKQSNKQFYETFEKIYKEYSVIDKFRKAKQEEVVPLFEKPRPIDTYQVVIQTYLKINLDQYPDGGRVYFYKSMIKHVISLYFNDTKIMKERIDQRIQGLPLSNKMLEDTRKKTSKDQYA